MVTWHQSQRSFGPGAWVCSPVCCYELHDQGQVTVHLCDLLPTLQDPGHLGRAVMGVVAGRGGRLLKSRSSTILSAAPHSALCYLWTLVRRHLAATLRHGNHLPPACRLPLRTAKAPGPAESFSSFSSHTGSWEMCRPFRDTEHLNLRCTFSRIHKPRFTIQLETNAQASKAVLGLSASK